MWDNAEEALPHMPTARATTAPVSIYDLVNPGPINPQILRTRQIIQLFDAYSFPRGVIQPRRTLAPPSTGSVTPVMKLASSEARNNAALATSHAVPILRRSGTLPSRSAATSARLLPNALARVSTA